jgi:hypothetical protein
MILGAPILWSMLLTVLWGLGPLCGILFTLTGVHVGMRYFYLRTVSDDELSYVYYNVSDYSLRAPFLCHLLITNYPRVGLACCCTSASYECAVSHFFMVILYRRDQSSSVTREVKDMYAQTVI